ncbi:hypothetical protein TH1_110 [Shewanella phage Thanatos-1]|nr:hypothetical protein TH1_110 [Shewanella phage Thanatos-1]
MNYVKIYNSLIGKRCISPAKVGEIHHIVPRSMGGSNSKNNLVKLTYREHFVAHMLLFKIHRNLSTAHALNMMNNSYNGNKLNSSVYSSLRKIRAEELSTSFKKTVSGKAVLKNIITGEIKLMDPGKADRELWVGVNSGNRFNGRKGYTVYKDSSGNCFSLKTDDPKIAELGLKGIGNTVKATEAARLKTLSKPWYARNKVAISKMVDLPVIFEWYNTIYDPEHPKKTGLARCLAYHNLRPGKYYSKCWHMFIDGHKLDNKFYEDLKCLQR